MLNEDIWNTTSSSSHQPYSYSKTLAEREAWKMVEAQDRWSLVVINPSLVLGPTVSGMSTSASHDICLQMGDGTMKAGAPPMEIGMVDVRDVADAHIRAAYIPDANGRHIVSHESCTPLKLSQMLQDKFGQQYPLPKKELPKWLVWLVGPIMDKSMTRRVIAKNMGHPWKADNSKSKEKLGLEYRSLKSSITDMFQQMIDEGSFKKS
jgi:dihydroflavonol-4-reductase